MRRLRLGLAWLLVAAAPVLLQALPAGASEPINGGGSTWSAVAIQQWQSDLARQGFTVNYQPTGSTSGRINFYNGGGQYDFAVSEIPFQPKYCSNPADPTSCDNELSHVTRPFLYMPIVAGGTSILYNLQINGQRFTQLHLSPKTLTEMFTGVIKFWDAADVAADNPGVGLPHTAVTPVIRSDGSGTSYQFTAFMASEQPGLWNTFCQSQGISLPCPPTSQYPPASGFAAQNGSDGVANFVAAPYNNGAIGYAEAAYGIQRGVPLASLRNASGAYVQPTGQNVAVALTAAVINADHTQNLLGVYANSDSRAYPMSSYSYMIVPTWNPANHQPVSPMDLSKGATLGQFILYFLCQGQQEAQPLGYSPLPPNLVQLGFSVEQQVPGAPAPPPINQCNNPTITGNYLGKIGIVVHGTSAAVIAGAPRRTATNSTTPNATAAANRANQIGASITPTSGGSAGTLGELATGTTLVQATSQNFGKPWRAASVLSVFLVGLLAVGLILVPPTASLLVRRRRTQGPNPAVPDGGPAISRRLGRPSGLRR